MSTKRERLAIIGIVIFLLIGSLMMQSDDDGRYLGIVFYGAAAACWHFMLRGGKIGPSDEDNGDAR